MEKKLLKKVLQLFVFVFTTTLFSCSIESESEIASELSNPAYGSYFDNDKSSKVKNVIYTRRLEYIEHPECYDYICLYSLKVLNDKKFDIESFDKAFSESSIKTFKQKYPKVKLLMSLGGGSSDQKSNIFLALGGDKTSNSDDDFQNSLKLDISEFAKELVRIADSHHIDGIDIDWEYHDSTLCRNYNLFYKALVIELDKLLRTETQHRPLSIAGIQKEEFCNTDDIKSVMNQYVDFVSIMCYNPDNFSKTINSVELYKNCIDDKSKLLVGIPYYGRYGDVDDISVKNFPHSSDSISINYDKLIDTFGKIDIEQNCSYSENGMTAYFHYSSENDSNLKLYTFPNVTTIKNRVTWIKNRSGCGGIVAWVADGDKKSILQDVTYSIIK